MNETLDQIKCNMLHIASEVAHSIRKEREVVSISSKDRNRKDYGIEQVNSGLEELLNTIQETKALFTEVDPQTLKELDPEFTDSLQKVFLEGNWMGAKLSTLEEKVLQNPEFDETLRNQVREEVQLFKQAIS